LVCFNDENLATLLPATNHEIAPKPFPNFKIYNSGFLRKCIATIIQSHEMAQKVFLHNYKIYNNYVCTYIRTQPQLFKAMIS
jgi:hypothetical protein